MPELPEVETVRAGLEAHIVGKKVRSALQLHPRALRSDSLAPLNSLEGAKINAVKRRGKFLWIEFNRPEVLVAHLGMSGQFKIQSVKSEYEKHLRANFLLSNEKELRFVDQRTFGWLLIDQLDGDVPSAVSHIARDLFDDQFNMKAVVEMLATKSTQIKKAILEQGIVSGIGNIYADESLWRAKLHPETPAKEIGRGDLKKLLAEARKVMERALAAGGTSFDDLYINVNGESGYFERALAVYGREGEPCRRCGSEISRIAFGNRSSRFCPTCQTR